MPPLASIQCHHNCQFPKQTGKKIIISKYSKKYCLPNIIKCYLLPKTFCKDKRIISTIYAWASEKKRTHEVLETEN